MAQQVCAGEEPAPAALLLVADAGVGHFHAEVGVLGLRILLVDSHLLNADAADSVMQGLVGRGGSVAAPELLQHIGCKACLGAGCATEGSTQQE